MTALARTIIGAWIQGGTKLLIVCDETDMTCQRATNIVAFGDEEKSCFCCQNLWQDVIWIKKKCAEIKLLKKSMTMWFLFFWDFIMAVRNQIMQKIIKKLLSGYFLAYPPKMHYRAPQCSAMYCSVNAWVILSRRVKYDPEWPRMTDYSPGWHTRGQGGTRGSRGAQGGARGR